jgi:diguanylate cyclase (GGDEF)-like protein
MAIEITGRTVPPRALALSLAALLVPVSGALRFPDQLGDNGALLWLTALVPAFLLAYYRGWRGSATALALGMATLSMTQVGVILLDREIPTILAGVVVAYLAISLGIGWLAETLHRDRSLVEDMAFTDLLTRLPNRRHARMFLENEFAAAERGRRLSVVLFDLDHFKEFNDRYGHPTGDTALAEFGDILGRTTRRMDLSARYGGEEFVSILTSSDTEGALIFADRIRGTLGATPIRGGGKLTVSAGLATYHPSMRSPDELLAAADHALYQAKNDGRNRVRLFGRAMLDPVQSSRATPSDLLERLGEEPAEYPRDPEEIGRTKPPLTLLPHQITGFGKERTVLVVEDDHQVRGMVSSYLEREGFTVERAADVPAGLETLARDFDIVVTDLRLPGPSGTELVSAVKSRWPMTQVVVITGLQDATTAAEALAAGADRYLLKPFGMPELRLHLVDALNRRDRARALRIAGLPPEGDGRDRAREAQEAILEGTAALVRAAEKIDPHATGHGARVAAFAMRVADALDPDGVQIDRGGLRLGCILLDLGKVGVPESLWNKEGPVEAEERHRIEHHVRIGRTLLEPLLDDEVALSVVSWHHERWDGSGYPDGLRGASIPLPARVAAVCDALEAMTRPRAYRPAFEWELALKEVLSGAGTAYDPKVIQTVAGCAEDLRAIFDDASSGEDTA